MYDRSIEINQNIPDTYYNKRKILDFFRKCSKKLRKIYNEAIMMFDCAIEINPKDAESYCNKGIR